VLFYNVDICKKAGLLESDGKTLKSMDGPDAFIEAMQKVQDSGVEWGGVCSVNNDTATNWRIFISLYAQLGGEVLADEGKEVVLDKDKTHPSPGVLADAHRQGAYAGGRGLRWGDRLVRQRRVGILHAGRMGDCHLPDSRDAVQHDVVPQRVRW
jgi:hypothetical protein